MDITRFFMDITRFYLPLFKNFTCPFCIQSYNIRKVLYVCQDDKCGGVITRELLEREPVKCYKCGLTATIRQCPSCEAKIPIVALQTPNLPFSIVGIPCSGKTNLITVMLHELYETASELRLSLVSANEDTKQHQASNLKSIYELHKSPPMTLEGKAPPQIWVIKNLKRRGNNKCDSYTFTIFDGAGEEHQKLDRTTTACRYISTSKAIIVVIDPLVLSQIRKGGVVDPEVRRNSLRGGEGSTMNAEEIVHSLATYIKTACGINIAKLLKIPVAVVLTKFDRIISHKSFGPQALIKAKRVCVREGKVDITDIIQVDDEIRNWLMEIGESRFIDAMESHFKDFRFFGVSSYGSPPKSATTLADNIRPHRVLDPLLWIFKKMDFVD